MKRTRLVRNVEDEVWSKLKKLASVNEKTMGQMITLLIEMAGWEPRA